MKKIGVIDIGSNSVRLMLKDEQTQKFVRMTQLGKMKDGLLTCESVNASLQAIKEFTGLAKGYKLYCFATEAVRSAKNGKEFCQKIKDEFNLVVDILTPSEEAKAGFLGAGGNESEVTVLDVGGASTEIITGKNGNIECSASIPIGAVRLFDRCGEDLDSLTKTILSLLPNSVPVADKVVAIGGTATAIGAMLASPNSYDKEKVHGYSLTTQNIDNVIQKLVQLSIEERVKTYPVLPEKRAKVMVSGASVIKTFMDKYSINSVTLSDSDNAEGYLILRKYED